MAPKKTAAPAEKKEEGKSAIHGLDLIVRELTDTVEEAVKKVGGDVARSHGERAVALMREAEEALYRGEKEDR